MIQEHFVISGDVIANLTKDLTDLDVELEHANTVFGRTFWVLVVCTVLSGLLLVVELYKIYKKRGRQYKEKVPDCEAGSGKAAEGGAGKEKGRPWFLFERA